MDKPTIAMIDDDYATLLISKVNLEKNHYRVLEFQSGVTFLEELDNVKPDLILVDAMMPEMDGFALCRELRKRTQSALTPIMMITSLEDYQSIQDAFDAGATDFVTKPINWDIIKQRLQYMLRASHTLNTLNETISQLHASEKRLANAQRIASMGHWEICFNTREMYWSKQLRAVLGASRDIAPDFNFFIACFSAENQVTLKNIINEFLENKRSTWSQQMTMQVADKEVIIEQTIETINIDGAKLLQGTVQDVTEKKKSESKLWYLSNYDSLTNLPNKKLLIELLDSHINECEQDFAVLFISIDQLHQINEAYGHTLGDQLLCHCADRINQSIRLRNFSSQSFHLARFSSDEFVIFVPDISESHEAAVIAKRLIKIFQQPIVIHEHTMMVTISIGISVYPEDGESSQLLLKNAASAMPSAHEQGGTDYQFYSIESNHNVCQRFELETKLRLALKNHQFHMVYQPQYDCKQNKITGAEALIRWQLEDGSYVPPDLFIPIAERIGLIDQIGKWTIQHACREMAEIIKLQPDFNIAVNISSKQLTNPKNLSKILKIVEHVNFPLENLELEITESALMENQQTILPELQKVRDLGIGLAIDDFGTGYSSLAYLRNLPISKLKIDRTFIEDMARKNGKPIVQSIITLAHNLTLNVTAEGVNDAAQLSFLHEQNCDQIQGYYISKPISLQELQHLVPSFSLTPKG